MDYNGPVTVTMPDGAEHDMRAQLVEYMDGNQRTWRGSLETDEPIGALFAAFGETITMTLPDGTSGRATVAGIPAALRGTTAEITGSGPARSSRPDSTNGDAGPPYQGQAGVFVHSGSNANVPGRWKRR